MLDWGKEYIEGSNQGPAWHHTGTNLVLDFHGDPANAELAVYSDGNHHMALLEAVNRFRDIHRLRDVFYTTTPPGPLVAALRGNGLRLGNLYLARKPDVFISPSFILDPLERDGFIGPHRLLFNSRGNVLLVPKGNPKAIQSVADLQREDIATFISNPDTEKASYTAYNETLTNLGATPERLRLVYGEKIHHRESPQTVADGRADCAILYYHLALRYTRLFPQLFEIIPLGGSATDPQPVAGNAITNSDIALVGDGGALGQSFVEFMLSTEAGDIYRHHGMTHG